MLLRVIVTEAMKVKRTLALWMVFVAPLVVVLLQFLIAFIGADVLSRRSTDVWQQIATQTVGLWTVLMMPLFLTLETSLLAGVEHGNRNWKVVLALPPPRWAVYVAKLVVVLAMLWGAHAVLVAGTLLSGVALAALRPVLHLSAAPWSGLIEPMMRISVAALFAAAIQHWVSLRWQSFTAAMGVGMCAMVVGFIAVNSADYGPWVPWSMPMFTMRSKAATWPSSFLVLSSALAGALVVSVAGALEFSRRDFS